LLHFGEYSLLIATPWKARVVHCDSSSRIIPVTRFMTNPSTGSALTLDTNSTSFYAFSGADSSAVNGLEFYGEWIFSSKYTGSSSTSSPQSCNILANTSSSSSVSSEYAMKGTFGSSSSPCVVTNLLTSSTDGHVYTKYNGSFTTAGTFGGSAYAATITTKTSGDATSGSYTGMFKYAKSMYDYTTKTYNFGYGTYEINDGTTKVEFKAEGSTYKVYVNGALSYTYPSSSTTY